VKGRLLLWEGESLEWKMSDEQASVAMKGDELMTEKGVMRLTC
jgi:hypothetical protein